MGRHFIIEGDERTYKNGQSSPFFSDIFCMDV